MTGIGSRVTGKTQSIIDRRSATHYDPLPISLATRSSWQGHRQKSQDTAKEPMKWFLTIRKEGFNIRPLTTDTLINRISLWGENTTVRRVRSTTKAGHETRHDRFVMETRLPLIACWILLVMTQAGCVALNIPSQRYFDPADHGGAFGAWSNDPGAAAGSQCAGGDCVIGQPLEVDPFDTSVDPDGKPKPPEIPWPRFHPIPTRPVFGPDSL